MDPVEKAEADSYEEEAPPNLMASVFAALRLVSIMATMVFVIAGAVLAYDFFFFIRGIITEPEIIVRQWQDAVLPLPETPASPESTSAQPGAQPAGPERDAPPNPVAPAASGESALAPSPDSPVSPGQEPGTTSPASTNASNGMDRGAAPGPARPVQTDPWLDLAEQALQMLETGQLNWLAGMAFLVLFCWLLVKVPVLMITTGSRIMVDLFRIGKD